MAYCIHCGKENKDGAAFCRFCGAPMATAGAGGASSVVSTETRATAGGSGAADGEGAAPVRDAPSTRVTPTSAYDPAGPGSVSPGSAGKRPAGSPRGPHPAVVGIAAGAAVLVALGVGLALGGGLGSHSQEPAARTVTMATTAATSAASEPAATSAPAASSPVATSASAVTIPATPALSLAEAHDATTAAAKGSATGAVLSVSDNPQRADTAQVTPLATIASSALDERAKGFDLHDAGNLFDNDFSTAWVEGASGNGPGEYLVFDFDGPTTLTRLCIAAGFDKSEKLYGQNARPEQVTIIADGEVVGTATLADEYGTWQVVDLGGAVTASSVALRIDSVYAGSYYSDCAISELFWA